MFISSEYIVEKAVVVKYHFVLLNIEKYKMLCSLGDGTTICFETGVPVARLYTKFIIFMILIFANYQSNFQTSINNIIFDVYKK